MYKYLIGFLIIFIMHCNDVKISVVKISEISLIFYGLYKMLSFRKTTRQFFYLFSFFIIVTLIHNLFLSFDNSVVTNILQAPYICSVGRYIELLCCLAFVELVLEYCKANGNRKAVEVLFRINAAFCGFLLVAYFLEEKGIIDWFDISLDNGRMIGGFNEGGPFGLLIALLIVLSLLFKRSIVELILLIACLFFSASKAGAMLLLIVAVIYALHRSRTSKRWRYTLIIFLIPLLLLVGYVGYNLVVNYGVSWTDVEYAQEYADNNPDDYSFVAGRVSGRYIGFEMIKQNPLIGIGLGNYPIMRNLKEYRSFFPQIKIYDASGLGGIFDLIVQQGFIGFSLFFFLLYRLYRKSRTSVPIVLFVVTFICGVQLTFVYPWILIAMNEFAFKRRVIDNLKSNSMSLLITSKKRTITICVSQ